MTSETNLEFDFSYDEDDDILYVAVRGRSGPAITYETDEGHLVRLDPRTQEFLGAEVPSFRERWEGRDLTFVWETPEPNLFRRFLPRPRQHEVRVPARRALTYQA